jgi:hypothetical protein
VALAGLLSISVYEEYIRRKIYPAKIAVYWLLILLAFNLLSLLLLLQASDLKLYTAY